MRFGGAPGRGGEAGVSGRGRDALRLLAPNTSSSVSSSSSSRRGQRQAFRRAAAAAAAPDPFRSASRRLESLLAGLGDGEEELLNSMLMEEPAERKLQLVALTGALVSGGAAVACWAFGTDPLGGASWSASTLRAAGVGGVAAAPLVALKAALWSDAARAQLPFLEDIQGKQRQQFESLLYRLTPAQAGLVLSMEVIPGLLILLPAACGGIAKSVSLYGEVAGVSLPAAVPVAVALSITALLAAAAKVAENEATPEECDTIKSALENADRFYRLTAPGEGEAARAADAFRTVAITWLARNQVASRFAAWLGAAEVLYLGLLWQRTGDLAAPLVAGLAAAAVDFAAIRRSMPPNPDSSSLH